MLNFVILLLVWLFITAIVINAKLKKRNKRIKQIRKDGHIVQVLPKLTNNLSTREEEDEEDELEEEEDGILFF